MNYYFLLEDEKSFIKVLPLWLEYIGFECTRVVDIQQVKENNYVLQSGQGVTQLITKILYDTIDTILANPGAIDRLVIILDSEEMDVEARKSQVYKKIDDKYAQNELKFETILFVCNHCFETWLLGKNGLYPTTKVDTNSFIYFYTEYFNISEKDPENMLVPESINETIGQFHFHYLHEILRYKRIRYSKKKPNNIATKDYFEGIVKRTKDTNHLKSFQEFYNYFLKKGNFE